MTRYVRTPEGAAKYHEPAVKKRQPLRLAGRAKLADVQMERTVSLSNTRLKDTDLAFNPAERRDAHGRWTAGPHLKSILEGHGLTGHGTGSGSPTDPINVKGDVMLAARLIGEGKNVRLNKVHDIGTLIHDLASALKKNPTGKFDLCRVSLPKTNLFCAKNKGIERINMPQLSGTPIPGSKAATGNFPSLGHGEVDLTKEFEANLRSHGVKVDDTTVPVSSLKATQNQLVGIKVAGIADFMRKAPKDSPVFEPIFVTRDNYVIDGHHRWAAQIVLDSEDGTLGNRPIAVRRVNMDIGEALAAASAFQKDMGLPVEGFTQTKAAVSLAGTYHLKETDLTRYVRTPEGAAWYGEPIGSPITGNVKKAVAKAAVKASAWPPNPTTVTLNHKKMTMDEAYELVRSAYPWDVMDKNGGGDKTSIRQQHLAQIVARDWFSSTSGSDPEVDQMSASLWQQYQDPNLYGTINRLLRTGKREKGEPTQAAVQKYAHTMFEKGGYTIDKPMTVYRALKSSRASTFEPGDDSGTEDWAAKLKPGVVFSDAGIVSTTANERDAEGWLTNSPTGEDNRAPAPNDVVVEIRLAPGQRIVGGDPQFIETMLPPGTSLKVVSSETIQSHARNPLDGELSSFPYTRVVAEVTS